MYIMFKHQITFHSYSFRR